LTVFTLNIPLKFVNAKNDVRDDVRDHVRDDVRDDFRDTPSVYRPFTHLM
jgi:hypothetical protein